MKIDTTFHVLVLFMAVLTLGMPFVTLAQENSSQTDSKVVLHQISVDILAQTDAERDAEADTKQVLWIGGNFLLGLVGGCVLGSVGLLGAYLYEPQVPASRLMGKSPEYVMFYTDAYKARSRDLHLKSALIGCLGGSVVSGCVLASYLND